MIIKGIRMCTPSVWKRVNWSHSITCHFIAILASYFAILCLYSNTTCKYTVVTNISGLNEAKNIKYIGDDYLLTTIARI